MNSLIKKQLDLITEADLSNFDEETNTYHIPKREDIKAEEENCYLIHCKSSLFLNETVKINWNKNSVPEREYLIISVSQKMAKMINVDAIGYDIIKKETDSYHWKGWINLKDIDIIQKL